jgi:predicted DNA-binding transcriptional regulator YafY
VRADRLLSLLSLLQAHGRMSAHALAGRLEVSERTVYRDMEALSAAGVPVYTERGRGGGCVLMPGFRTDVSGLTTGEARALFTFTGRGLGMDAELRGALSKLLARLPQEQRSAVDRASTSVVVDPHGWMREQESPPHLPLVQEAVWQHVRLRMSYRDSADDRVVDPYGLVAKAGVWYLIAAQGGEPRLYRASRIVAARLLDEPADQPEGLDVEALWSQLRSRVEDRPGRVPVSLRVKESIAERVVRVSRPQLTEPGPDPLPAAVDGWVSVELIYAASGAAAGVLAGFGADVVVTGPEEVCTRLRDIGRALVAEYD